jgi:hypothetical protein
MIRLLTLKEEMELFKEDEEELIEEELIEVILAQLSIIERKIWKVTDCWGNTIQHFVTKEEALLDAVKRNKRAFKLGLWIRYRIDKDQGYE